MTPLFTEQPYAPVVFPALSGPGQAKADQVAYANGHAAGYMEGLRKAAAEGQVRGEEQEAEHAAVLRHAEARTDRALQLLAAAAGAVNGAVLPAATEVRDALADAALELAETILGVELGDRGLSSRAALARALDGAPATGTVTVKLHPADLAVLTGMAPAAGVVLAADNSVGRGDAVAEFEHGHLNACLADALARSRQALLGVTR